MDEMDNTNVQRQLAYSVQENNIVIEKVFLNGEPTWYLKQRAKACRTPLSSAGKVLTWYLKRGAETL